MSQIEFTERRKSKAEKRFYARCSECNDGEWYPMIEHRRWHRLYEYLEGAAWTANWVSDELRQMDRRKTFTFSEKETTQEGQPVFSFKIIRKDSSLSKIIESKPISIAYKA